MNQSSSVYFYQSRTTKPVLARSYCEIKFESEAQLQQCVEALKTSDEKMSMRPESEITYEWDAGITRGTTLFFGVKWYDREFFIAKKDAYKSSMHEHLFSKFSAKISDFQVNHYVLSH